MQMHNWLQFGVVAGLFVVLTPLLGGYMARVYGGGRAPGERVFGPVDRTIYRLCGIDPDREQRWTDDRPGGPTGRCGPIQLRLPYDKRST